MAKDRFVDRFRRKQDKRRLGELSKRGIPADDIEAEEEMIANTPKVDPIQAKKEPGRNDPCPCGSGKKYKNCCGANK